MEVHMRKFSQAQVIELKEVLSQAKDKGQCQRVMAVWLRTKCGLEAKDVAETVGWSPNSVHQIQSRYLNDGAQVFELPGRGGRRRENLTLTEEGELLSPFIAAAKEGGFLTVAEIRNAYNTYPINKRHI